MEGIGQGSPSVWCCFVEQERLLQQWERTIMQVILPRAARQEASFQSARTVDRTGGKAAAAPYHDHAQFLS